MKSQGWARLTARWLSPSVMALLCLVAWAAPPVQPFESEQSFAPRSPLDEYVLATLRKKGLTPARICSDEVFVRRVYLDVIGTLPTAQEADAFLRDTQPDKRTRLIDALLQRDEYAQYWGMKWGDILRIKAEFPINLWPNAAQAYDRWVRDALAANMPYDQFVRALLTSSGSNFRVPPVNFYRAVQSRTPEGLAAAVALTFMGTRLDKWPEEKRQQLAAFFSRVAYKKTLEWKEEIVYLDPTKTEPLSVVFPDGTKTTIPAGKDPREVFADWLIRPNNPWFCRAIVNRVWAWLMGRGIIHEPDDIRESNPPVNPELLAYLQQEFVKAKYDLKALYRLILNSATYQQSFVPANPQAKTEAEIYFAVYPIRRLEAEVLLDALSYLTGQGQGYCSQVPEPFTWIPETHRAISLPDGSITSAFLEMFGRPPRDTGLESERNNQPSAAQELYLLNSVEIHRMIQNSKLFARYMEAARGDWRTLIQWLYLAILSRRPTEAELAVAEKHFKAAGTLKAAVDDLAWALINTKEFLFRH